jgi:hypothetical protein
MIPPLTQQAREYYETTVKPDWYEGRDELVKFLLAYASDEKPVQLELQLLVWRPKADLFP